MKKFIAAVIFTTWGFLVGAYSANRDDIDVPTCSKDEALYKGQCYTIDEWVNEPTKAD